MPQALGADVLLWSRIKPVYSSVVVAGLLRTHSFTLGVNEFLCLIFRSACQIYSFRQPGGPRDETFVALMAVIDDIM